jgi:hypothetical protein
MLGKLRANAAAGAWHLDVDHVYGSARGRRLWGMQRLVVDPMGVSRSYEIVSSEGTNGNPYQRLLRFTTARRKAPEGLFRGLLARYQIGRRRPVRAAYDAAGPADHVTITLPAEPRSRTKYAR